MAEKIVIASGKGGVGKTSLSVGIGKALHKRGRRVLIIDCDELRSVDLLTGVTGEMVYDWSDVIFGRCEPEQAIYKSEDVSVATCPVSYAGILEDMMREMVALYEQDYDYILLDAPAGLGRGFQLALCCADRGIVVSTADLVCVRAGCTAAGVLYEKGIEDVRLIINRVMKKDIRKGRLLNLDSVIDSTQVQLIGVVPEDSRLRLGAMGKNLYSKKNASYIPITNIAARIEGEYIALAL